MQHKQPVHQHSVTSDDGCTAVQTVTPIESSIKPVIFNANAATAEWNGTIILLVLSHLPASTWPITTKLMWVFSLPMMKYERQRKMRRNYMVLVAQSERNTKASGYAFSLGCFPTLVAVPSPCVALDHTIFGGCPFFLPTGDAQTAIPDLYSQELQDTRKR